MSDLKFEIENRVASSALVTIDLDDYLDLSDTVFFDLKPFLFQELILREKEFRAALKDHDWQQYQGKPVVIGCTAEAIIPTWSFMLVASKLTAVTQDISHGSMADIERKSIDRAVQAVAELDLEGKKVVIKGCGGITSRDYAYTAVTTLLTPIVSSLMYGEPCSTVPIYKRPRR